MFRDSAQIQTLKPGALCAVRDGVSDPTVTVVALRA